MKNQLKILNTKQRIVGQTIVIYHFNKNKNKNNEKN